MNELLAFLLDPANFKAYGKTLTKKDFEGDRDGWDIFQVYGLYFNSNSDTPSLDGLKLFHLSQFKQGMKAEHKARLEARYKEIAEAKVNSTAKFYFEEALRRNKLRSLTAEMAEAIAASDTAKENKLAAEIHQLTQEEAFSADSSLLPLDLASIRGAVEQAAKYRWFLPSIDRYLKGFGPGRSVLIFARTSVGKTSFLAGAMNGFMKQGARVLDVTISESEDPYARVLRHFQAEFAVPDVQLLADLKHYHEKFTQRFGTQFARMDGGKITIPQLRKAILEHKPDIVSVDNYTKLSLTGTETLNHAKQMGMIQHELKALQREYSFGLISVCQANAEAEGAQKLQLTHIQDSKTDVPGELQSVIGLARSDTGGELRYISFPKNKPDSSAENIVLAVRLDEARCQWYDV